MSPEPQEIELRIHGVNSTPLHETATFSPSMSFDPSATNSLVASELTPRQPP